MTANHTSEALIVAVGWSPRQGHWVKVRLDPEAERGPHPLMGCEGKRYMLALAEIADDETPAKAAASGAAASRSERSEAPKEKSEGEKAVARAGILCNDPDFQRWVIQAAPHSARDNAQGFGTADILRAWLGVTTRKALATDADVLERFQRIDEAFKRDATTRRYQGIRT